MLRWVVWFALAAAVGVCVSLTALTFRDQRVDIARLRAQVDAYQDAVERQQRVCETVMAVNERCEAMLYDVAHHIGPLKRLENVPGATTAQRIVRPR